MLRSITLKNFRKHKDVTLNFSSGLNVLRGSNESGKSTVLEGLLYALYGAKVLRNSLAETVTWGHKEHELSVKLILCLNGSDYVFTRSKSGAECNYAGPNSNGKVVGQSEVTSFSTDLLGADAKTAAALMMASQSGLRGALDDGPTAVSSLMSKLADFDLIDRIVERAQETLLLGAETPLRGKIETAEAEIEMATEALPDNETVPNLDRLILKIQSELELAEEQRRDQTAPAVSQALSALTTVRQEVQRRSGIVSQLDQVQMSIAGLDAQIRTDEAVVQDRPKPEELDKARAAIRAHDDKVRHLHVYTKVVSLPAYPEVFWEGTKPSFDEHVQKLRVEQNAMVSSANSALREIETLKRTLIKSGRCPTCGHEAMSDEHVRQHNAGVEAEINKLQERRDACLDRQVQAQAELDELAKLSRAAKPFEEVLSLVANRELPVTIDLSVYPPKVDWVGEWVVDDIGTNTDLRKTLTMLEERDHRAAEAAGRLHVRREALATATAKSQALIEQLDDLPVIDVAPYEAVYTAAEAADAAQAAAVEAHRLDLQHTQQERAAAQLAHDHAWARLEQARVRLREYEADLKTLTFNNALLKKIKGLKPAITDYLWNTVLSAVSNFMSQMRGEQSVVTKDNGGFKVNGQSVDSLSGSTLDVLALAIRVALTRTFIPNTAFITLDEPAHGCDTTRTGNVLGFLSAVGFDQTLLASHDELSEAVADNVIQLGD